MVATEKKPVLIVLLIPVHPKEFVETVQSGLTVVLIYVLPLGTLNVEEIHWLFKPVPLIQPLVVNLGWM
jgi:hypothetical protein